MLTQRDVLMLILYGTGAVVVATGVAAGILMVITYFAANP
jgi:hypothetical protein